VSMPALHRGRGATARGRGRWAAAAAMALVLAGAPGCVRYVQTYALTFRSTAGVELAVGEVYLSSPLPADGEISGWYKLRMRSPLVQSKDVQTFYQLFKGHESGHVDWTIPAQSRGPAKLDFMPNESDANVVGTVRQLARGYWGGRWSSVLFTGVYDGGTCYLSLKTPSAHP
jgi:hypothetical protein